MFAGKFIKVYLEKKIFKDDPFQTLDQVGVGQLMQMAVLKGRKVRKEARAREGIRVPMVLRVRKVHRVRKVPREILVIVILHKLDLH